MMSLLRYDRIQYATWNILNIESSNYIAYTLTTFAYSCDSQTCLTDGIFRTQLDTTGGFVLPNMVILAA